MKKLKKARKWQKIKKTKQEKKHLAIFKKVRIKQKNISGKSGQIYKKKYFFFFY